MAVYRCEICGAKPSHPSPLGGLVCSPCNKRVTAELAALLKRLREEKADRPCICTKDPLIYGHRDGCPQKNRAVTA
jgi:hypothetical protein